MGRVLPQFKLRFSLRLLLVSVTIACVFLGRITYLARQQRAALATIAESEGNVIFDYEEESNGVRISNPTPPGPAWLRSALGEDYFRTPIIVDLATNLGKQRGDGAFKATPAALAAVSKLRDVRNIELGHNLLVDDNALAPLSSLRRLNTLYLYHTSVTGTGLAALSRCSIENLELARSPVTDSGLKAIASLRTLRYLSVDKSRVTDAGLAHLRALPRLTMLRLRNTDVSNAGLELLREITTLTELSLAGTKVTLEGVEKLRKALPDCQIHTDYGLGLEPDNELLFRDEERPTAAEIKAKLAERGIVNCTIKTDSSKPNAPIISFILEESTLGDAPILQLVRSMPDLELLSLDHSLATDAFLEGLANCQQLKRIVIRDARLTDDGMRHLAAIPSLKEIELQNIRLTDDAIAALTRLSNLRKIHFNGTKVTDNGKETLKEALPGCQVFTAG